VVGIRSSKGTMKKGLEDPGGEGERGTQNGWVKYVEARQAR